MSTTAATTHNKGRRVVRLSQKAGVWVLEISTLGAQVVASSQVPFSGLPLLVLNKIQDLRYKFNANQERVQSLKAAVEMYQALIDEMLNKLNAYSTHNGWLVIWKTNGPNVPFLEKVIAGFVEILDEVDFRCDKWMNKKFTKQMWSSNKYDAELASLKQKLDDYKFILEWGLAEVRGQNITRSVRIEMEGVIDSKFQQLQQERETFVTLMVDNLQAMLDKLDKAEDNQKKLLEGFNGMNLSHSDRMDSLEHKFDQILERFAKKLDDERTTRKWRLSPFEKKGSRSAVSESESPANAKR